MEMVYGSTKKTKGDPIDYLSVGDFDNAIYIYRNLGETRKAAKLRKCLERVHGDKEAACKEYLWRRALKKLILDFPLIIGIGAAEGALFGLLADSNYVSKLINPSAYVERMPARKHDSSSVPLGAAVGGLLGLYFASGQLHDEKEEHKYRVRQELE